MLLAVAHGDDFKLDELGVLFYFDIEVYSEIFSRTSLKVNCKSNLSGEGDEKNNTSISCPTGKKQ